MNASDPDTFYEEPMIFFPSAIVNMGKYDKQLNDVCTCLFSIIVTEAYSHIYG